MQWKHHTSSPHVSCFHCYSTIHAHRHHSPLEGDAVMALNLQLLSCVCQHNTSHTLWSKSFKSCLLKYRNAWISSWRMNWAGVLRRTQNSDTLWKVKHNNPKYKMDFGLYWLLLVLQWLLFFLLLYFIPCHCDLPHDWIKTSTCPPVFILAETWSQTTQFITVSVWRGLILCLLSLPDAWSSKSVSNCV